MNTIQERFVFDSKGKKTGVILTIERYKQLLEDLHDLAVVAERRDEERITLEEVKRRLKQDGIL
jgi:hypothetical protein